MVEACSVLFVKFRAIIFGGPWVSTVVVWYGSASVAVVMVGGGKGGNGYTFTDRYAERDDARAPCACRVVLCVLL